MGSYLSQPVTEKISTDESNDKLSYGASSMQGWRVSQEDAHNSILDFDEGVAFFAVYDGHGGHEVAQYCSEKLPEFIKQTEAYKKSNIQQALIDGFLGFDATIAKDDVIAILKEIAGDKQNEDDSDQEENINSLHVEASMPLEEVIGKYASLVNPSLDALKSGEKVPRSPMITAKKDKSSGAGSSGEAAGSSKDNKQEAGCSSKGEGGEGSSGSGVSKSEVVASVATGEVNGDKKEGDEVKTEPKKEEDPTTNGPIPKIEVTSADEVKTPTQNGDLSSDVKVKDSKGKGKAKSKRKNKEGENARKSKKRAKTPSPLLNSPRKEKKERPKRLAATLYKQFLDFQDEDDDSTEDEEDSTFVGNAEESSDDENIAEVSHVEGENSDSSEEADDEAGDEEDEDDDEDDDDDEEDEDDEAESDFYKNMKEEPGSDSGCTAVVAILKGKELYVANAGDSRCIVCRNGKAVEMSFDHKPEDEPEKERIVKAGGRVTADGRVNGGLNLSRAIGDHAYKQNKELSDKEQMITAFPDVKTLTINPAEDEFMVLACDGIWNYMSSQEVVDFVKPKLDENPEKISTICEELFDHCLAPNTVGDGTGCDNMTAIIVRFKPNLNKRPISTEEDNDDAETATKRVKTDDAAPPTAETSSSS
ncbi:probable protein phosphatase CG10417 isoform X2 [Anthonomus grandis grandis]|uniref:probable protein phosphatase CG10417 isoform X2 n=1 Tax=Anthonomus grandis grandis TaxID=2921223 RepID=UPI0021650265|nr:probable protein phosphatase CG10417 isoform X2 [Anthonomus grandis grandis]